MRTSAIEWGCEMVEKVFNYAELALIEDCLDSERRSNSTELNGLMTGTAEHYERLHRIRWLQTRNKLIDSLLKKIRQDMMMEA